MNNHKKHALSAAAFVAVIVLGYVGATLLDLTAEWWMLLREATVHPERAAQILQQVPASGLIIGAVTASGLLFLYLSARFTQPTSSAPAPAPHRPAPRQPRLPGRHRYLPRRLRR